MRVRAERKAHARADGPTSRLPKRLATRLGLAAIVLLAIAQSPRGESETLILSVADGQRTARIYVPDNGQAEGLMPLVLAFHGSALNGRIMEDTTGFNALAAEQGFVVAYPNGSGPANTLSWNTGHCCSFALERGVDDIAFVNALLDELIATLPIDPERIYATGFSNGGMLAYELAIKMPERLAAIAVVAGAMYPSQEPPTVPVPVLAIHGTGDQIVPYDGGVGLLAGLSGKTEPSLACIETIALWTDVHGCASETVVSRDRNARIETYRLCESDGEVALITLADGGHEWPQIRRDDSAYLLGEADAILGLIEQNQMGDEIPWDVFETGIDASGTIWAFFARH